ncbi:MAG: CHAP domain-containing protein, partial [Acidimicrobiaceae bacterium]|nr:CHAP domain-containing protein [Acidimicrobiaceae bacterium]
MGTGHTRWLWLLIAAILGAAILYAATEAGAQPGVRAAPTGGTVTFTLDGVDLTLSSPMLPGPPFVTSRPGSANQVASSSVVDPYRDVIITAVPFGTTPGTEKVPRAHSGDQQSYRSSLVQDRSSQGARPAPGPDASLFGHDTSSVVSRLELHLDGPQLQPTVIVEWVAQAGPRMWILRVSEQLTAGEDVNQVVAGLSGVTLTSPDPNHRSSVAPSPSPPPPTPPSGASPSPGAPSPSPSVRPSSTPAGTAIPAVTQSLVRPVSAGRAETPNSAPAPPWWSGTCDSVHNPGSFPLGSSYDGVAACGPLPIDGATDNLVQFFSGAWGEYEWECVELVMRYLYLVDGVAPYSANGSQVVWNYTGTALTPIGNGIAGKAPVPGDVLSYGSTSTNGHTSIVSSSSVNGSGNGTVTVVEQNNTTDGTTTMQVSNWVVQGNPYPVSGWLQPGSRSTSVDSRYWVASNSTGALEVFLRGGDSRFWTDYQRQAGNNASWSGWYPLGGTWPGEPSV